MKLFVDDIREAPDESWTLVRTISEAVRLISMFSDTMTEISLDHDISHEVRIDGQYRPFPSPETFQPVAYFIGELYKGYRHENKPKITLHTANPVGASNMYDILSYYEIIPEMNPMGPAYRKK